MKKIFQRIFLKDINNYWYWIILAVVIKVLFFAFMLFQNMPRIAPGAIYVTAGDTNSYIAPIENLISKGLYFPDFRMPGYGAPYFLFRLLFSKTEALNLLAFTQLLLSVLSVYFLALAVRDIFERKDLFYATFYGYLLSTYTSIFDIFILTESLAVSSLIFAVFYFIRGANKNSNVLLFLSGCFLTWSVFLRPFLAPLIGLFILVLVFLKKTGNSRLKIAKAIIIFFLPFLLIDGAWVFRNYEFHSKVIPLQNGLCHYGEESDKIKINLGRFFESWGGDHVFWNPKAEINWFGYEETMYNVKKQVKNVEFPDYIYTSKFNHESLVNVKNYIAFSKDETLPMNERNKFRQLAADRLQEYTESIKKEKPCLYYIYAPARLFKKFLFHSGTYNLFNKTAVELNIAELAFKLLMSLMYLFVVIAGLAGIMILFFRKHGIDNKFLVAAIPLYVILFFSVVFRACEYRFFVTAYPFMLICAAYAVILACNALAINYRACGGACEK